MIDTVLHATTTGKREQRIREPYRRFLSREELEAVIANPNQWVSDTIAALITGIPRGTLRTFRTQGRGPRYRKDRWSVRYQVRWLLEYVEQTTIETRDSRDRDRPNSAIGEEEIRPA
jgi:hypothetical protein